MQTEERAESTATATDRVILGLPVDTRVLFSDKKGIYKPRIEKRRMKLLQNLGFLGRFLDAEEKILLATTGCSPFTALEQMTIGAAWVVVLKRCRLRIHEQAVVPYPHHDERQVSRIHRADPVRGLSAAPRERLVAGRRVPQRQEGEIPATSPAAIARSSRGLRSRRTRRTIPARTRSRNHLCPHCATGPAGRSGHMPLVRPGIQEQGKGPEVLPAHPGRRVFLYRPPVHWGRRRHHRVLPPAFDVGVSRRQDFSAILRHGLSPSCFAVVLAFEKLITIYHSNSFLAEFIPMDLKRLLRGQPVPAKLAEPLPALPEVPEQKQRPEDVLSVR